MPAIEQQLGVGIVISAPYSNTHNAAKQKTTKNDKHCMVKIDDLKMLYTDLDSRLVPQSKGNMAKFMYITLVALIIPLVIKSQPFEWGRKEQDFR